MTEQTVTTGAPYSEIAAELRLIADDLDGLGPGHPEPGYVTLDIQPCRAEDDDETRCYVDDVAVALIGKVAESKRLSGGSWHHTIRGRRGPVDISVYQQVRPPDERDAELERLRAELAALRSTEDPDHGRTTAVADAKPDTLMVSHGDPGDGHAYECCGKVGRISRHNPGCPVISSRPGTASTPPVAES